MKITRPFNSEDNELNIEMNRIIEHWAKRHGETIIEKEIYTYSVRVLTENGRHISASKAECGMRGYHKISDYIYLKEIVNGKHKRIKKEEW